jgi:hypothetical protein
MHMLRLSSIALSAALLLLACRTASEPFSRLVVTKSDGSVAGSLVPAGSLGGAPSVTVALSAEERREYAGGGSIAGIQVTAWPSGDRVRADVYTVSKFVDPSGDDAERVALASYDLRPGQTVLVKEMEALGLAPLRLTLER